MGDVNKPFVSFEHFVWKNKMFTGYRGDFLEHKLMEEQQRLFKQQMRRKSWLQPRMIQRQKQVTNLYVVEGRFVCDVVQQKESWKKQKEEFNLKTHW